MFAAHDESTAVWYGVCNTDGCNSERTHLILRQHLNDMEPARRVTPDASSTQHSCAHVHMQGFVMFCWDTCLAAICEAMPVNSSLV